jgi:glycosyltransferase involved in cell wall biosynthesis
MNISLVIPAYNEEEYISACLSSVALYGKELFEVIVVDNASTDTTATIARTFPFVRVVHEPKKGLTRARACGLRAATGDIIAYIDADTVMPRGWVAMVNRAYRDDKELVCVSGPYIYDYGLFGRLIVWAYWLVLAWPTYFLVGYMAVGGNFAAKRLALVSIGGFDESISFYGEDTDIARRLATVGKVKFLQRFFMHTSARRLKKEGALKTAWRYIINYISIVFMKNPVTMDYTDIR